MVQMNALNGGNKAGFIKARQGDLLGCGLEALRSFAASRDRVQAKLRDLAELGDPATARRVERLVRQLETFEPSVTLIGQVKSGKTSLVNALIGAPDLLPADVNPWTSVITSLHLRPETSGFKNRATFRFFDKEEWDRLIRGGGRIGELARRAGAEAELEKIKQQALQMRETSRRRLGDRFEKLLGQQRAYDHVDKELVERYVCLGDALDQADSDMIGRFADITKSADLYMTRAALPMPLCLRDTPGVNDTFMMREQITIRAIRDSQICVVVLSAHQALSSTDMALIRLISLVKSRDVVIFVNRVDELSDPAAQIPQIRESIAATLKKHQGPRRAEVLFGSALWAGYALQMRLADMPASSAASLASWAADADTGAPDERIAWRLSGLPALQDAIAQRVADGVGAAMLQRVAASALNLTSGLAVAREISNATEETRAIARVQGSESQERFTRMISARKSDIRSEFDAILSRFAARMERVQNSFLERATVALIEHLARHGSQTTWRYDPAGLRALLRASHKVLARNCQSAFDRATEAAAAEVMDIYAQAFALGGNTLDIARPRAPQVPPPVSLGSTIALDLNDRWWKQWWRRRRGTTAHAAHFHKLLKSEISPVLKAMHDDLAQSVRGEAIAIFDDFLSEQLDVFERLTHMHRASPEELAAYIARHAPQHRRAVLKQAMATLNEYARR
ncbi:hypothetical protein RD1_2888 [Roseobacter denitrificans OCh 114]|uniref:Dynamin N-terminal domain-containing protein n=2 Tax=Roseobacter denitrificans TaxID=2434 RepID=Q165D1_ROSDO|nr:hypothetical protein RD1_2888 [Roseobacter denitrificans OCh 114]